MKPGRAGLPGIPGTQGIPSLPGIPALPVTFTCPERPCARVSGDFFERRGVAASPRRVPCEFCGEPLVDPIEEPFNLAFIAHLKGSARCMELFGFGMTALRNELGVRLGQRPVVDGL